MFPTYHTIHTEKPKEWRSAYEIYAAALEHEKWRRILENGSQDGQPALAASGKQTGWSALLKAPLRLLMNFFG